MLGVARSHPHPLLVIRPILVGPHSGLGAGLLGEPGTLVPSAGTGMDQIRYDGHGRRPVHFPKASGALLVECAIACWPREVSSLASCPAQWPWAEAARRH